MRRDSQAFPVDILEASDAILDAVRGISLEEYQGSRLIRSAVEREFILIGEALTNLSRLESVLFNRIDQAPRIISFRNKITHEYTKVDHTLVWGVIRTYLQPLRADCALLLERRNPTDD